MPKYTVSFTHRAKKNLRDIPVEIRHNIEERIWGFARDPGPHHDVKKMQVSPKAHPLYRLRVGEYRILMYFYHDKLVVEVISIFKREGAY